MTRAAQTYQLTGPVLTGPEQECGRVWVHHGRLRFTDPGGAEKLAGWVLPGLVDMHCHIGLGSSGPVDREVAAEQAAQDLRAGTLLVRDAGSPVDTRWLDGNPDAPHIIRAGRHLARPKRYLRNYARELDDVAELPDAMGQEAARGDGWVKLVGDWIDRARGEQADLEPLWPRDELAAGVAAAHARGARVTVHTFATETMNDLFAAGVDCIEHGTGMTAEHIERAAAAGIPVVPTMLQVANFGSIAAQGESKFPQFAARMRQMFARREQHVRDLHDAGVQVFLGTDAGGTIGHGRIADEARALVAAGIPAADVVASATWSARDYLGRPGLVEGAPADVVLYPADPRVDIDVLAHPRAVIRAGRRIV
ncbi:amidohydrolase family protein [Ruania halotolerans]|uniref:amidohydrolase family protein n=1 Tax=Ruania halotolerans TaxID=2897773 RepID=UPI001E2DA12F|nr:amidohydrolase family protein [Ruania halotolerans]UFU05216.1 amidohydrolase family protein [Ruania halotolerans]